MFFLQNLIQLKSITAAPTTKGNIFNEVKSFTSDNKIIPSGTKKAIPVTPYDSSPNNGKNKATGMVKTCP
jgi:hypothetical protein